jgi:hypothetical protein
VRANREAPALSTGCLLKHLIHPFFFGFYMSGEHRHLHFLLVVSHRMQSVWEPPPPSSG